MAPTTTPRTVLGTVRGRRAAEIARFGLGHEFGLEADFVAVSGRDTAFDYEIVVTQRVSKALRPQLVGFVQGVACAWRALS